MLEFFSQLATVFNDGSLIAGFMHPFLGLDHVLVMAAVGLWAFQIGGHARLAVPAAFMVMMVAGFTLATRSIAIPFVEPVILASLVGCLLLVALAVKLPVSGAAGIVAVFAIFHGNAHGSQVIPSSTLYCVGFMVATALLHAFGLMIGLFMVRRNGASTPATL